MKEKNLTNAINIVGGVTCLASILKVTKQAVSQWDKTPAKHCLAIETATKKKVTRFMLRPDIFGCSRKDPNKMV